MKKTIIPLIIFTLIIVFSSCKKTKLFDYRNKYIGEYDFEIHRGSFNMNDTTSSNSTVYYDGEILNGEGDSTLNIIYRKNSTTELYVSKDGELYRDSYYPTKGEFTDDGDVEFSFYSGGMGGGTTTSVKGTKK